MSIQSVRSELEKRLAEFASSEGISVAWEGVYFDKPADGVYLQPFLLPGITINPTVDATRQREVGIFQINVWGLDGKGTGETETLARKIVSLYPIIPKSGSVSIESTPYVSSPIIIDGWRTLPVTIMYRREL